MNFPNHLIDPRKKDQKWHLQYCKAAWDASENMQMFYRYAKKYDEIAAHVDGTDDKKPYLKATHVDEQTNQSAAVMDMDALPHLRKLRQDCISYLQKAEFNIEAEMVDALARDERDQYFADLLAKLLLRNELEKVNPELANAPSLRPQAGEPLDEQELEMVKEYGYKSELAKESEMAIEYVFLQNHIDQARYFLKEKLIDNGVAVVKDWMEPSGKIKFRVCDNRSVVTNYCRYADFRDLEYCGEVISVTWPQFVEMTAGQFSDAELEEMFNKAKASNGWSSFAQYNDRDNSKCKLKILDLEWFSVDEQVYEDNVNRLGNPVFVKARYSDENNRKDKFKKVRYQNVYRAKWVVDTEIVFDWGKLPYQKVKGFTNAELSYHIRAINFSNMRATGITEGVIPIAKQLRIAWLKIQNVLNDMPTHIVKIDVGALENINYSKSGKANMTPTEVIQMFFQNRILLTRQQDPMSDTFNPNFQPVEFLATNFGQILAETYNHFANLKQMMMDAMGLNDVTIGNPNAKNLNSTNEAALQATSNALYHVAFAEEKLLLELAYSVLCRLKRAVKMGKVEGYVPALGTGTMEFFRLSPEMSEREIGLKLVNKPSAEEEQFFNQMLMEGMQSKTIDATDMVMFRRVRNIKQREEILAYRIKKRTQEQQQQALQMQRENANTQIQSVQAKAQADIQTLQAEYDLKVKLLQMEKQWDYKIKELELGVKHQMNRDNIQSSEKQAGLQATPEPTPLPDVEQVPDNEGMEGEMAA